MAREYAAKPDGELALEPERNQEEFVRTPANKNNVIANGSTSGELEGTG